MLRKIGRKVISVFLAVALIMTTFFIFDPGFLVQKSKAVVDVKKLESTVEPTVKFFVPETIYLNPVVNSGSSQPYSFQYFIDCDENGTLHRSSTQTTGTVFFSCSSVCSSISITWENSTANTTTVVSNNQTLKQTVTGGTTAVSDGRVKVTCTYVVGGVTYTAVAYTYMYYPDLDLLTGTASSYVYSTTFGDEPKLASFSFITGVHYVGNKTSGYGSDAERGVSNYYDQCNTLSSKGAFGVSPLVPGWANVWDGDNFVTGSAGAEFKTANDDAYVNDRDTIYGETTSNSKFIESGNGGVYFHERDRDDSEDRTYGSASYSWGTLYVDTSRVTNYNQIPNLRGGFICHYYARSGKTGKLDSFRSTDEKITVTSNIDYRNGDGKGYGMSSSETLSGEVATSDTSYTMQAKYCFRNSNSHTINLYNEFGLNVKPVNKSALRNSYRDAIEQAWQSDTATRGNWNSSAANSWATSYNNYAAALDNAGTILGKPYATSTEISNALSSLNSAKSACETLINANFSSDEKTESLLKVKFYVPETIYLNPDNGTAFQYIYGVDTNGVATKDTALSSATSSRIYFTGINCNPTSVKITCEAATSDNSSSWAAVGTSAISNITFGGTSFTGSTASSTGKTYSSFPVDTTCSGGSLSAAVASGSTRFIRWRADYVVDGVTHTVYAYSVCYRHPMFTAYYRNSSRQYTSWNHSPAFINANITVNGLNVASVSGDSGTTSSGSGGSGSDNNDANRELSTSIILDSSRFSNYIYVPYLSARYQISDSRGDRSAEVKAYDSVNTSSSSTIGSESTDTQLNVPITGNDLVVYMHVSAVYRSKTAQNYTNIKVSPNLVDKSSLRSRYNNAVSEMRQQRMYSTGYDSYQNSILAMALKLGNPVNTNVSGSVNTDNLVRYSGTTTATYLRETSGGVDYNGNSGAAIIGTEKDSKNYSYGDDVYGYYSDVPGFTLSRYSVKYGSDTINDGLHQDSNHNNYYYIKNVDKANVDWTFWYTPNTYSVSYDPNGGEFNGTTGNSSTSVVFQTKYIAGDLDGIVPAEPTRIGYTFVGWKCDLDGVTYNTNDTINWDYADDVTFVAQWEINTYTITFKVDDNVIQSSKWNYGTTPSLDNGAVATKPSDNEYQYIFKSWTPEIVPATEDAVYVAQFESKAHNYKYISVDGQRHKHICEDCDYVESTENHNLVYDESISGYRCTECGYTASKYVVTVPSNCSVTQKMDKDLTPNYYIATIVAPLKSGNKYFVYWVDTNGEIVSTYRTYSFFVAKDCGFTPVYAEEKNYTEERNKAVIISRVLDCRADENGTAYSLYVEHSVAKTGGSINSHGVLYTTDASQAGSLTVDNDNIEKKVAGLTSNVLTGLLEVKIEPGSADTVYARSYVVDADGEVHYGVAKSYDLTATTSSADDELVTLNAASFDLTAMNTEDEAPAMPSESGINNDDSFGIVSSFLAKLIDIINTIMSFFTNSGARI